MNDTITTQHQKFAIGDSLNSVIRLAILCRLPLLLGGPSGIGKSQIVRDLADSLGIRLVVLNLALFESSGELLGLPIIDGDVTRYRKPSMLPDDGLGILLIEEAARSAPHVMAPFYEFLTSRRIGDYTLPEGWAIVACMNPPGPDYDGHPFDKAMRDRFMHVEVVADLQQWLPWAERNDVHPAVLDALRADSRVFALASPRTWYRASTLLRAAAQMDLDHATIGRVLAAELQSVEAAHAVMRWLCGGGDQVHVEPAEVLARYAFDRSLRQSVLSLLEQGRTDAVEKLVHGVEQIVASTALAALIANGGFDLESLERFASDVPGDRGGDLLRRFGANPAAGMALSAEPEQALLGYRRSPLFRHVAQWLEAGLAHRVSALVQRVLGHLQRLDVAGRTAQLRSEQPVRASLAQFLHHVGERAAPLQQELERLGLGAEQEDS